MLRKAVNRIKVFVDYFPILWNDYDWDYGYLLILLSKKLDRMANCIEKGGITVKSADVAKEMRLVKSLIDREIEGGYNYGPYPSVDIYLKIRRYQIRYAFNYMGKKILRWWD